MNWSMGMRIDSVYRIGVFSAGISCFHMYEKNNSNSSLLALLLSEIALFSSNMSSDLAHSPQISTPIISSFFKIMARSSSSSGNESGP